MSCLSAQSEKIVQPKKMVHQGCSWDTLPNLIPFPNQGDFDSLMPSDINSWDDYDLMLSADSRTYRTLGMQFALVFGYSSSYFSIYST